MGLPPAHAIQTETPTAFIRSLGAETIEALSDSELSEKDRITEFRRLFLIGLDFRTIGRFVLGRHWRRATRDEIRAFEALFAEYVVTTYAMRLARYQIDTLTVGEVRVDGHGGQRNHIAGRGPQRASSGAFAVSPATINHR